MREWRIAAALLACLLLPALARADELTPEKTADIKKLLAATKADSQADDLLQYQLTQVLSRAEQHGFALSPKARGIVEREVRAAWDEQMKKPGGVLDQLVPVYADMLTAGEVKEYLAFYESPLGRKIAEGETKSASRVAFIFLTGLLDVSGTIDEKVDAALRREGLTPQAGQPARPAPENGQI